MNLLEPAAAAEHAREFWDRRYKEFSLSESGWMGAAERYNAYLYECKRQALVQALCRIGVNSSSSIDVLDAGCGQGFFAGLWSTDFRNARYAGVDICEKAIAHLRNELPYANFFTGDLTSWRHPEQKAFDIIHAFHVFLMFVSDAAVEGAVLNLASQLKPGGHLLVTAAMPETSVDPSEYTRHQSRSFWEEVFRKGKLTLLTADNMYYWLPDGGPRNKYANKFLRLPGPWLLYALDRLAHRMRLPQKFGGWDSRTKLLVLHRT